MRGIGSNSRLSKDSRHGFFNESSLGEAPEGVRNTLPNTTDKIEPHFLPKYSRKLTGTEYIWRKVNRMTTHHRYFETAQDLAAELFRGFKQFRGNPASLRSTVAGFA